MHSQHILHCLMHILSFLAIFSRSYFLCNEAVQIVQLLKKRWYFSHWAWKLLQATDRHLDLLVMNRYKYRRLYNLREIGLHFRTKGKLIGCEAYMTEQSCFCKLGALSKNLNPAAALKEFLFVLLEIPSRRRCFFPPCEYFAYHISRGVCN